jgi:hypothetical protein
MARLENVCQLLKSILSELEGFKKEQWANIVQSWCVKLLETYPKIFTVVITTKGDSNYFINIY